MVTMNSSTMKMDQQEIESYCKTFLKDNYNLELEIPIAINGRLTKVLGAFVHLKSERKPLRLEFSKKYLVHGKLEDIQSTLRHECIHYALYVSKKPYRDGHPVFESELRKHDSNSTRTTSLKLERNVNVYKCNCSEHTTVRALSNMGAYHTCSSCKSYLKYMGKRKALV